MDGKGLAAAGKEIRLAREACERWHAGDRRGFYESMEHIGNAEALIHADRNVERGKLRDRIASDVDGEANDNEIQGGTAPAISIGVPVDRRPARQGGQR